LITVVQLFILFIYTMSSTIAIINKRKYSNDTKTNEEITSTTSTLSPEQQSIIDLIRQNKNVFFTGGAGCGKSFVLKYLIKMNRPHTYITSSTGVSAIEIEGTTLYTFGGIGNGEKDVNQLKYSVFRNKDSRNRWKITKTLIIDEISMITGSLFTKLDQIGRYIRQNNLPFGGIQLIVCGDFLQLPPVIPNKDKSKDKVSDFAFESIAWTQCFPIENQILLKTIFRQQNDTEFTEILNRARFGCLSQQDADRLNTRVVEPESVVVDGVEIKCISTKQVRSRIGNV
jgi:ATP-dependent DNA helicase PIF1